VIEEEKRMVLWFFSFGRELTFMDWCDGARSIQNTALQIELQENVLHTVTE